MRCPQSLLCLSLLLCGFVPECFGFTLMPKDKRGWTLNSAGYLLGPHAHRTLTDKGGLAGKREAGDELYKSTGDLYANQFQPLDENALQTVLDFLSYLRLRDLGALDHLALALSSEESTPQ
ncbi:galanin peptides-like [Rhinatrema bivittatum]|uniref:galanin peptides-like n=1 Tax=Rhinatrema bivittatum TaxID=194408 RepID=UPI001128A084|nr:galanin peptides-like [Rhinatrema bivittatum]